MEKVNDIEQLKNICGLLFLNFIREMLNSRQSYIYSKPVNQAIAFINENYNTKITLESLANNINLNSQYLSRIFKKETGLTVTEYINKIKISNAKHLFCYTNFNITNVSLEVGFSSQEYFSKVFKKFEGLCPKEYKAKLKSFDKTHKYIKEVNEMDMFKEKSTQEQMEMMQEMGKRFLQYKYQTDVITFKNFNTILKPGGTVLVGDSITEGFRASELLPEYYIINRGIGGDTTEGILNRMNESIFDTKASKIFLMIGTNDLGNENKKPDEIVKNITEIINQTQEKLPDLKIYLESVYPISKAEHEKIEKTMVGIRSNKDIDEINCQLETLAKEKNITYIDVNSHLKDENGNLKLEYTTEGLHLSALGYIKVVEVLKPYMSK